MTFVLLQGAKIYGCTPSYISEKGPCATALSPWGGGGSWRACEVCAGRHNASFLDGGRMKCDFSLPWGEPKAPTMWPQPVNLSLGGRALITVFSPSGTPENWESPLAIQKLH